MAGADWVWWEWPLEGRTGSQVFARLGFAEPVAALLESPPGSGGRYSLCAAGRQWVALDERQLLPWLRRHLQLKPHGSAPADIPFSGGWWGWLAYEAVWGWERLPPLAPDPLPFPVGFWWQPDWCAVLDHDQQRLYLGARDADALKKLGQRLRVAPEPVFPEVAPCGPVQWQLTPWEYQQRVHKVQAHIRAGDIFQANLSVRFGVPTTMHPWQVYRRLTQLNPSPFACYWQTPWGQVVSCSPERLVQVQGDAIETRPIAGTRPRGRTPAQDQALAQELQQHPKERAEHIMLVDLERNDLGRVCQVGSVQVAELLTIERYSHVMHLVSRITGKLRPECTLADVFQAVFPGGTITGCPKVRCMEILHALEPHRRNLFYGSCGYWDVRGQGDWNILIRTLLFPAGTGMAWGQVGAGIVSDSDPEREWRESLQKAQAQLLALGVRDYDSLGTWA
ncbi:MAG: anthranilate synthase component I [Gloeomargarita sp. SKYG116]|nr:anthranilate synthase component I [Gloeomargarita sp. SKYG116]MCS7225740.1 anthranilate synthase component I [Gloeomargarita sp. SKYB31]MDW8400302.1 anthranilate synthase component I [Gloeomargarita sp. SKYGB_i_bin116]